MFSANRRYFPILCIATLWLAGRPYRTWTCFVPQPDGGLGRRGALAVLPALLGTAPADAAPAPKDSELAQFVRVQRPKEGKPLYSFEVPVGPAFEVRDRDLPDGSPSVAFIGRRKDAAFVLVMPLERQDQVARMSIRKTPFQRHRVDKLALSDQQDDLELDEVRPMMQLYFTDEKWGPSHLWVRALKSPTPEGQGAIMMVQLPRVKMEKDGPIVERFLNSFRLEA